MIKNKKNSLFIPLIVIILIIFLKTAYSDTDIIQLQSLNFSTKELKWLKSHKTIKIAGPRAFPPFHYYDEKGNLRGISADYIFLLMKKVGIKLEIEKDIPWASVLDKAKTGEIDLIPCAAKTKERESYLNFSKPYLSFPLIILSRKDSPFIGGIDYLYGKKLAVINKNSTMSWLKNDNVKYKPYYVETPLKKLEALSLGKVDAAIENLAAASYIIQQYGFTNLKIAAPTPYSNYNLHMAVNKDMPELVSILNKIIEWITPEQHMQIRNKWLSVRYEYGIRKSDLIKYIFTSILVSTIILIVIIIWNRKLKKEALEKALLIEKLEKALNEIHTLKGIVPICSCCKKIRDDKGYWNLLESYLETHFEASFSHGMCPECTDKFYGNEEWYKKMKQREPYNF